MIQQKAEVTAVAITAGGPMMIDILGQSAPALSMVVGLIAVLMTRIMILSNEPRTRAKVGWWYYNVSLTILLTLVVFITIIDRKLGPGTSVILGIGVGASGILIVDTMKKWVTTFFATWAATAADVKTQEEKKP